MFFLFVVLFFMVALFCYFHSFSFPKLFGIFSQSFGPMFYCKKLFAYLLVQLIQFRRNESQSAKHRLRMDDIFELTSDSFAMNSVAFNCSDSEGNIFVARISRRHTSAEIWLAIKLSDGRVIFHSMYPLSTTIDCSPSKNELDDNVHILSAGGIEVHFVVPLKTLRLTFSGNMREVQCRDSESADAFIAKLLAQPEDVGKLVKVSIRAWFRAFSNPIEALSLDIDPWSAAHVLASEKWHRGFFKSLSDKKFYRANLQQAGQLTGYIKLPSEVVTISMHGLRTRTVGVREWRKFTGYCVHCGRLNDGSVLALGALSQMDGFSHAPSGYLFKPNGKVYSISWTDFHLASLPAIHSPDANLPAQYSIAFEAGGHIYPLTVKRYIGLPIGHGVQSSDVMVYQNLVQFDLDGVLGYGSVEYQFGLTSEKVNRFLKSRPSVHFERVSLPLEVWEQWRELDSPVATNEIRPRPLSFDVLTPLALSLWVKLFAATLKKCFYSQPSIVVRCFSLGSSPSSRSKSHGWTKHFRRFACRPVVKKENRIVEELSFEKQIQTSLLPSLIDDLQERAAIIESISGKVLDRKAMVGVIRASLGWHNVTSFFDMVCAMDIMAKNICSSEILSCNLNTLKGDKLVQFIKPLKVLSGAFESLVDFTVKYCIGPASVLELERDSNEITEREMRAHVEVSVARTLQEMVKKAQALPDFVYPGSFFERRLYSDAIALSNLESSYFATMTKVQTAFENIGRSLTKDGKLSAEKLVFYLTFDEVEQLSSADGNSKFANALARRASSRQQLLVNRSSLYLDDSSWENVISSPKEPYSLADDLCGSISITCQSIGASVHVKNARLVISGIRTVLADVKYGDVLVLKHMNKNIFKYAHILPILSGIVIEQPVDVSYCELFMYSPLLAIRMYNLVCLTGCTDIVQLCHQRSDVELVATVDGSSGVLELFC